MAYAMLLIVAVLSLMPVTVEVGVSDKTIHFLIYSCLSAGFMVLLQHSSRILWVILGLISYSALIEVLQGMTGYRYMEGLDILANSLGVMAGVIIRFTRLPLVFRTLESRF